MCNFQRSPTEQEFPLHSNFLLGFQKYFELCTPIWKPPNWQNVIWNVLILAQNKKSKHCKWRSAGWEVFIWTYTYTFKLISNHQINLKKSYKKLTHFLRTVLWYNELQIILPFFSLSLLFTNFFFVLFTSFLLVGKISYSIFYI